MTTRPTATEMPTTSSTLPVGSEQLERRMTVLRQLAAAGRLSSEGFDRLTRAARTVIGAPLCLVVLVDDHRQIFVSALGLGEPLASAGESPLGSSVCQYVVASGMPLVSSDLRRDEKLKDHLAVLDLGVVAYAGMPVCANGECVGTVCVIDVEPRQWSSHDLSVLTDLAAAAEAELSLHLALAEQSAALQELRLTNEFLQMITQTMPGGLLVVNQEQRVSYMNEEGLGMLGWSHADVGRSTVSDLGPSAGEHPAESTERYGEPIAAALADGFPTRVSDDTFLRRDGTSLPVAYSVAPTTLPDGAPGAIVVFTDNTERRAEDARLRDDAKTLHAIARIKAALAEERFVLYAQPIIDLVSGEAIQHELLIRMIDPDGTVVPPFEFLPIAEEYGLIKEIDRYVIERALQLAAEGHPVELNISAHSLSDHQLGAFVEERLAHYGVDPSLLVFEITETALVANEETATQFATLMTTLGCAVALDDFGTGYGSFHYLKHIPAQILKIDREFVRDIHTNEASRLVIQAVISLAKGLGMTTVAEGIEDQETLETLRRLGVDHAQGYHLGRPAPAGVQLKSGATPVS